MNDTFEHPADGFYLIEPRGEHYNAASDIIQVIDEVALQTIKKNFDIDAAKPNFPGLLIDADHRSHDLNQSTRAMGWLVAVEVRKDGLSGKIRWTAAGKAAVDGGEFRFFSTEYNKSEMQNIHGN